VHDVTSVQGKEAKRVRFRSLSLGQIPWFWLFCSFGTFRHGLACTYLRSDSVSYSNLVCKMTRSSLSFVLLSEKIGSHLLFFLTCEQRVSLPPIAWIECALNSDYFNKLLALALAKTRVSVSLQNFIKHFQTEVFGVS
jgi:hypothetical protein